MATYRIGIGSFNLKDGAVGIGTESSGLGNLKVEGTYKTTDLDVIGVSTFQRYAGFAAEKINVIRDTSLSSEHSTIGDIVVGLNSTFTVSAAATVTVGTVESVSIGTHFSPPTGGVEERPEAPVEGTVRFNTDLNTLEFYNGIEWRQFIVNGVRGRGVTGMWENPAGTDITGLDFVEIQTKGNAVFFGDLTVARMGGGSCSSSTRGLFAGGNHSPTKDDEIDYITIASSGNAQDFGNLGTATAEIRGCSSSTRGLFAGGQTPSQSNTIEYVEIPTLGNASDFGDLSNSLHATGGLSSPTRGIFGGGHPGYLSHIDFVNIASTGNANKFGELTVGRKEMAACSNFVRGIFAGGPIPAHPSNDKTIDYITIASTGNASDFGDLTVCRGHFGGAADQTRAVFFAGRDFSNPSEPKTNIIDYIEIATTGNAVDFGDATDSRRGNTALSDSHGGLGGI